MIKMPLYKIFKINTERLDREEYDIHLSFNQACINGELVEIASNQALRKLMKIMKKKHIASEEENFIPCYICIHVDKKKHYKHIKKNGLYINGKKFIRYSCGAGNARNNNVFMIWEELYDDLYWFMSCGIKEKIKVVKNKWSAYFALTTSSSYPIPEPRVCVIPDYKMDVNKIFDYITYDETKDEYHIERKPVEVKGYVPFDGMGLVSVEYMRKISEHLQMDYIPSAMVIRQCWIKGLVACMDFKEFSKEISGNTRTIDDLWGKSYDINDIDIVLTESQFKMWHGYDSWEDYVSKYRERGIEWGCAKVSPKKDKTNAFTNYQFIQVLDLDDTDIENLCKKTIDWLGNISGGDVMSMILYMCGNEKPIELENISDSSIKALIYNNKLVNDNYIKQKIVRSLNKKIREAYSGRLLVDGNFSFMISDPYALLEYAMGLEPKGLLNEFEHYNGFWNKRNVDKVVGMRSPLTHYSEVNLLNLKNDYKTSKWYKYLDVGCTVFNIYGDDTFRSADADDVIVPFY